MLMVSCNKDIFPDLATWINNSCDAGDRTDSYMDISGTSTPQSLTTGFFNVVFTRAEVINVHKRSGRVYDLYVPYFCFSIRLEAC